VLWVRSYRRYDTFDHAAVEPERFSGDVGLGTFTVQRVRHWGVGSYWGRIEFHQSEEYADTRIIKSEFGDGGWSYQTGRSAPGWPARLVAGGVHWDVLGFGRRQHTWAAQFGTGNSPGLAFSVDERWLPHWLPCLVTAILPALASARLLRRRRRRRRVGRGLCPACGYDLRATPGRCPECGWAGQAVTPRHHRACGVQPPAV
jgi:hypothetical protein